MTPNALPPHIHTAIQRLVEYLDDTDEWADARDICNVDDPDTCPLAYLTGHIYHDVRLVRDWLTTQPKPTEGNAP